MTSVDVRNCRLNGDSVGIHNGFCERSKTLRNIVDYEILRHCMKDDVKDIVFTGHSAGGCIAQIYSVFSQDMIGNNFRTYCFTYGSPKTGDVLFKEAIEEVMKERLLRIETYNDIVCLLPMQNTFEHAGNLLILQNRLDINNTSILGNVLNDDFFDIYYRDYVEFIKTLKERKLMTREKIEQMISEHSCEKYTEKIICMINDVSRDKINKSIKMT
jgi:hypothetical protein